MATWTDVEDLVADLPGATPASLTREVRRGTPAGTRSRGSVRTTRGRALVQVWSGEMDLEHALAPRRTTFPVIHTFRYRVSLWARLDLLDRRELAELLLDSHAIRGGQRRAAQVDREAFLRRAG